MWVAGEMSREALGVEREVLDDFMDEFQEAHRQCEAALMDLERNPGDKELVRSLFRSIHTVKGNMSYVHMNCFMPLLQSMEDVLDDIRNDRGVTFDDTLSDVILLAMDATHRLVSSRISGTPPPMSEARFDEICKAISAITDERNRARYDETVLRVIQLLDPDTGLDDSLLITTKAATEEIADGHSDMARVLRKHGVRLDGDIAFFHSLIKPLELRSVYWRGRTERLLRLAMAMNEQSERLVDPAQLAAAVFVHDIGMAFLPLDMLLKSDKFTSEERELMNSHPAVGLELLKRMSRWRPAAEIVLQHHERSDGSGYPQGLKEQDICDGAKILGIVESFDARTHERAHRTLTKRPFIRAVLEINNCSGQLFSEAWVQVFNEAVRSLHDLEDHTAH